MSRSTEKKASSFICTGDRCLWRRDAAAAGEEHSAEEKMSRVRGNSLLKNWRRGCSQVSPVIITVAAEEEHSADEPKNRINITSFICSKSRCLQRRDAVAAGNEHSPDKQKNRIRGDVSSKK
jgi:hypothetical protein